MNESFLRMRPVMSLSVRSKFSRALSSTLSGSENEFEIILRNENILLKSKPEAAILLSKAEVLVSLVEIMDIRCFPASFMASRVLPEASRMFMSSQSIVAALVICGPPKLMPAAL